MGLEFDSYNIIICRLYSFAMSLIILLILYSIGAVVYTSSSRFGPGNGPVFLGNTQCTGSEEDLLACRNTMFVGTYCTHGRDVGVRCEGIVIKYVQMYAY